MDPCPEALDIPRAALHGTFSKQGWRGQHSLQAMFSLKSILFKQSPVKQSSLWMKIVSYGITQVQKNGEGGELLGDHRNSSLHSIALA